MTSFRVIRDGRFDTLIVNDRVDIKGNLNVAGDLNLAGQLTADGLITSNVYTQTDSLTQPYPEGPYAVDHFQIARDNVQLRSPVKYTVASAPDLDLTGVEIANVLGVDYFGSPGPVYKTYPLSVVIDLYVPSTRADKNTTYDFFPDELPGSRYSGHMSLEAQLFSNCTSFFSDGSLQQNPNILISQLENQMTYIPDSNSIANLVLDTPLTFMDWSYWKILS
jgi:hypothetical protein